MKKDFKRTPIDYDKWLVTITLSEDENTYLTALGSNPRQSLVDLLNVVIQNPGIIEYNDFKPFKIELTNDNGKWILKSMINEDLNLTKGIQ